MQIPSWAGLSLEIAFAQAHSRNVVVQHCGHEGRELWRSYCMQLPAMNVCEAIEAFEDNNSDFCSLETMMCYEISAVQTRSSVGRRDEW